MAEESIALHRPVVPLPIALYESNGLLFELYQGGKPLPAPPHHLGEAETDRRGAATCCT